MKLRNKKTGEIWDISKVLVNDYPCWETLTQICEDWEDYKPKEPRIKNEKIRKVVRDWYALFVCDDEEKIRVSSEGAGVYKLLVYDYEMELIIENQEIIENNAYTITELCGEEEE